MAYDRNVESTTLAAQILKEDDSERDQRVLINVILEALDYSQANLSANSVATIASALDTLLSR